MPEVRIRKKADALEGWVRDEHRINLGRWPFPIFR